MTIQLHRTGAVPSHLQEDQDLLDQAGIESKLDSLATQIAERHPGDRKLVLVGIRTGGVYLAERLQKLLQSKIDQKIPLGVMDITLYRDDPFVGLPRPEVGSTEIPVSIEGRHLVLVDDVIYTGRTVRSALMELMDFGRPQCVELAVLVDRGHRELPIQPDYVGLKVEIRSDQNVHVSLRELGETDRVVILTRKENRG